MDTVDGAEVVVRVLANGARLAMEQAVLRHVAATDAGLPVAEVLSVSGGLPPVMVQRRLPGRRLAEVEPTDALCAAVAETLRSIHAIDLPGGGYGTVTADLHGEDATLPAWFTDRVRNEVAAVAPSAGGGDRRLLDEALAELDAARPLLDAQRPGLAHGDVQPDNLLVVGDRVTGVLDWEAAKSGPPAFDFGWWDWFSEAWSTPWPTSALLRSDDDDDERDERDELRHLVVLRIWTRELVAAISNGDARRADAARGGLSRRRGRRRRRS